MKSNIGRDCARGYFPNALRGADRHAAERYRGRQDPVGHHCVL
jgi:hypothetical protein